MKKFLLLSGALILFAEMANAGILSNFVSGNYTNNGYYYPSRYVSNGYYPTTRPYYGSRSYFPSSQYNRHRYYNQIDNDRYYYPPENYYRPPVIYRTRVNRKSQSINLEKLVANQFSGIEKIEKQIMLQTYEYDSAKNRIERLEQRLFGASQEGDLFERFETIKLAAKNYKPYGTNQYSADENYRPPIFSGGSGAGWRNTLWGNFKNQFIGMPTGITPAMDPAYMDYFEAERAMAGNGQEVDYRSNREYYHSNTNRATGTGVTILDWLCGKNN